MNNPLTGQNPTFAQKTIREYGKNLFHEPIPMELLYSDATSPQVLVTIDDLPVVCPDLNCDYRYVATPAVITGQSVVGRRVTIDGTGLPTSSIPGGSRRALEDRASPFSVMFGGATCGDDTFAATGDTQITCDLDFDPEAGTHNVEVRDENGLVPRDESNVTPIAATISTASASGPRAELNQLGGDALTFEGRGYQRAPTDRTEVKITAPDGAVTGCQVDPAASNESQIVCKMDPLESTIDANNNEVTANVVVNGVSDQGTGLVVGEGRQAAASLTPNEVSPVVKQNLVACLAPSYPETLVKEDFEAVVVNTATQEERPLYVLSVDDLNKCITLTFMGAPSGDY